ncbi:MFS transporter [Sulfolobus acidocaldarius]|uniref:Conserved membrane protein n=4 Tax=Sulfolobus acidocaldarius TaxID=2285 RepID=Q4J6Z9_SULAC|nr:MFS transporter [Sulfolobus acidocaldarius]AAY81426.1 conserved membrane protein [Sulfolobus acidocaldarius DSM 639]ALU29784.1 ABC transporter permease [Sulfolobus acidocaldarius]ALU32522.1 ABC transporter permease [Sulfolobus acidocaldarius]
MRKSVVIGWLGTFMQLLIRLSWGVIALPISILLNLNPVEVGFVASSFYIGYILFSIPWGLIIDKIGPNKAMATSSAILVPLNLILFLFLRSYVLIVIIYLMEGIIASSIFPSAMKIIAITYAGSSHLTFYVAILESAGPITILLLGAVSSFILDSWKFLFLFFAVGFSVLCLLSLKLKVNSKSTEVKRSFSVLFNKKIILATLIRLGELWATWGTTTWIFSMLVVYRDIPVTLSASFLFLFGLGQLIGILSVESLVAVMGDKNVILINLIGFILVTLLIIITFNPYLVVAEAFLLGVFSFSYRPPTDSIIMKIGGESRAGTSIGFANAVSQLGTMIAPSLVGFVLFLTKSFAFSMFALDLGCVISIISLFLLSKLK